MSSICPLHARCTADRMRNLYKFRTRLIMLTRQLNPLGPQHHCEPWGSLQYPSAFQIVIQQMPPVLLGYL